MIRPLAYLAVAVASSAACAGAQQPPAPGRVAGDTAAATRFDALNPNAIPPGFGKLRQDDLALKFQLSGVLVKAIPLDESVIRVLSPDSYRALRDLLESRRAQVDRVAQRYQLHDRHVWYLSFYGLEPEAPFTPQDVMVTSVGRDFRPLEILPLSTGFGEQRLSQREVQSALYVFEDGINVEQPLTVTVESRPNTNWSSTLRMIERERALIRSRAATVPNTP